MDIRKMERVITGIIVSEIQNYYRHRKVDEGWLKNVSAAAALSLGVSGAFASNVNMDDSNMTNIEQVSATHQNDVSQSKFAPKTKDELIKIIKTAVKCVKNSNYYTYEKTTLNLNSIDVSQITDMSYLFSEIQLDGFRVIDVSTWDVSNVTNMEGTFKGCRGIQKIQIGKWDVSNVTSMYRMFMDCQKLESIDVKDWDVSNVTNMGGMFSFCKSLKQIDVNKWDVCNVAIKGVSTMFYRCDSLETPNLSNFVEHCQKNKKWSKKFVYEYMGFENYEEVDDFLDAGVFVDKDDFYAEYTDIEPQFPGGDYALDKYIEDNLRCPDGVYNRICVSVSFGISTVGDIIDVKVEKTVDPLLDEEAMRVIKSMPKWRPGSYKGKRVNCRQSMPIYFNNVYGELGIDVDKKPEYPGGDVALVKYIKRNVKCSYTGVASIKCIISSNGDMVDARSYGGRPIEDEIVRVVKSMQNMPKWTHGVYNGENVNMSHVIMLKIEGKPKGVLYDFKANNESQNDSKTQDIEDANNENCSVYIDLKGRSVINTIDFIDIQQRFKELCGRFVVNISVDKRGHVRRAYTSQSSSINNFAAEKAVIRAISDIKFNKDKNADWSQDGTITVIFE